jgi:hypothetical protein
VITGNGLFAGNVEEIESGRGSAEGYQTKYVTVLTLPFPRVRVTDLVVKPTAEGPGARGSGTGVSEFS